MKRLLFQSKRYLKRDDRCLNIIDVWCLRCRNEPQEAAALHRAAHGTHQAPGIGAPGSFFLFTPVEEHLHSGERFLQAISATLGLDPSRPPYKPWKHIFSTPHVMILMNCLLYLAISTAYRLILRLIPHDHLLRESFLAYSNSLRRR